MRLNDSVSAVSVLPAPAVATRLFSRATLAYKRGDPGWLSIRVWRRSQIAYAALCSGQLSVQKLALYEHPRALDLETEADEERRHRVQVRDGDADMVEASCV
jgi:hypothetical protein